MNLPEFDTFEFFGLIVPGSVVLFGFVLLNPSLTKGAEPAVLVVAGIVSAYILGHLINAVANICDRGFASVVGPPLRVLANTDLVRLQYIRQSQLPIFVSLIKHRLDRALEPEAFGPLGATLVSQIKLAATSWDKSDRIETFNGLVSFSKALAVSFLIALGLCLVARNYAGAAFCALAVGLSVYRVRKFTRHYNRELLQTFLYYSKAPRGARTPNGLQTGGSAAARPMANRRARMAISEREERTIR